MRPTSCLAFTTGRYDAAKQLYYSTRHEEHLSSNKVLHLSYIEATMQHWTHTRHDMELLHEAQRCFAANRKFLPPLFLGPTGYRSLIMDLHGYGHFTSQMAVLMGLKDLLERVASGDQLPMSDLQVCSSVAVYFLKLHSNGRTAHLLGRAHLGLPEMKSSICFHG